MTQKTILFTGYAPVHYLCFQPLYQRLTQDPELRVLVSGGLRTSDGNGGFTYDHEGLYGPLGVAKEHILPMDAITDLHADVLFSAHTNLLRPGSVGTTVQIFHGISFRNRGLRPANMGCDHYFVVGPYMERRLTQTGLMKPDDPRIVRIGFMKTDRLRNETLYRQKILAPYEMTGDRPVVLYAPTGAAKNSLQSMGEDVIRHLSETGKYDVLIKLHDHPKDDVDWPARLRPLEGPHTRVVRNLDVVEMLYAADLLISDASSVSNEFTLVDRPMVFLDVPKMIAKAESAEFQTIDLQTWGRSAGPVVKKAKNVVAAVDDELAHPDRHSGIRNDMANDLFYNPGRATEAAHTWLRETLFDVSA